ncbi:MAG: DUF881 domain-containing protein [Capsulimonadales bacterium]|nr:DUF881 domain-containing protein [Capsulimonadales bacterium]
MSVFTSPVRHRPWVTQVTFLSIILGALLALSLKTQDRIRRDQLPNMRISQLAAAYAELRDTNVEQMKKIADLQSRLTKYQKAAAQDNGNAELLSADLQKANLLAGMVAVTGPGVVVTLKDSSKAPAKPADMSQESYIELVRSYLIHDQDIQAVINELRAAGAEALAVNDQRVVSTTAVRCVGPSVLVNNVTTNGSPVRIQAIGDPVTLLNALNMKGGVAEQYNILDPSMIMVEKKNGLTLPAYAGAMPLRFAQPATDAKAQQAQQASEKAGANGPVPAEAEKGVIHQN